jgi:phosphate transport system permease protein
MEAALDTAAPASVAAGSLGRRRRVPDRVMKLACLAATVLCLFFLGWILLMVVVEGGKGLSLALFTEPTPGPGSDGGGLANAMLGSLVLTTFGIGVATPIGVLAGTYLAEIGNGSRLASTVRFLNDVLLSAPSILIGVFVYALMVEPMGSYSGWAGGVALAIIATPVIVRATEDMLRLVPPSLREAGIALGASQARVITSIVWRAARAGILTGILLATARISGETAPLLFTALNNNSWFDPTLVGGVANLPVTIYQFALSPFENWQTLAWAGALVITLFILALSILGRFLLDRKTR